MREMVQTEKDYVKSLEYVVENYIPELLREDIPQALRGQRNVIFGNIEKIYEFHSHHFLQELKNHEKNPCSVGQCFLRHVSTCIKVFFPLISHFYKHPRACNQFVNFFFQGKKILFIRFIQQK